MPDELNRKKAKMGLIGASITISSSGAKLLFILLLMGLSREQKFIAATNRLHQLFDHLKIKYFASQYYCTRYYHWCHLNQ